MTDSRLLALARERLSGDGGQTDTGIGVHEDTHIHHITELFIFKDQDSFHDDHFAGRYGDRVLAPVVDFVIIDRTLISL